MTTPLDSSPRVTPEQERFVIYDKGIWGYLDGRGKVAIPPQFTDAATFSEGLARVKIGEKRQRASAFIDASGQIVLGPGAPAGLGRERSDYDWYFDFHEGLAAFVVDGGPGWSGYIDRSGRVVIPAQFRGRTDFSDGLACVKPDDYEDWWRFIDPSGRIVLKLKSQHYADRFAEGRCVVEDRDNEMSCPYPYVIDRRGRTVIPTGHFEEIKAFDGGLALVKRKGKYGYVDRQGEVAIPLRYDDLNPFNGQEVTTGRRNGRWWIIDRAGRHVVRLDFLRPEEDCAWSFCADLAPIKHRNKEGYIDQSGRVVIPPKFRSAGSFEGSLARASTGRRSGYINRAGDFVWVQTRWEKPVPYVLEGLLMRLLPPETLAAQPLEFEWDPFDNVIVFASNADLGSLEKWYKKQLPRKFRTSWDENDKDATFSIYDALGRENIGDVMLVDAKDKETTENFHSWLGSRRLKALQRKHRPSLIGVARLYWPR